MLTNETPPTLVDYTNKFPGALLAQGQGRHFLCLRRLDAPYQRADGKRTRYQLDYRELSCEAGNPDDEAYVCVQMSENTYWLPSELKAMGINIRRKEPKSCGPTGFNIFDHVNLL
jgi:hypothetical protein